MYRVLLLPAAQRDLDHLDPHLLRKIKEKIRALSAEARPFGAIKLTAQDGYRFRSGDHRILYRIDDKRKVIYIYRVKHRRDSYR